MKSLASFYLFIALAICFQAQTTWAGGDGIHYRQLMIPDQSGLAMTVLGPIDPAELGHTLMHEHLYLKFWIPLDDPERWKIMDVAIPKTEEELVTWHAPLTQSNRQQLMSKEHRLRNKDAYTLELADTLPEVLAYKALGGNAIVDLPPIEPARRPLKLVELSKQTGVHIIAGSAFYVPAWHPKNINQLSLDDLTEYMVRDIVEGMDGTGVKAGLIGEVPAVNLELGSTVNNETRILIASARAARLTGAAITTHSSFRAREEIEVMLQRSLDIIAREGVDLSRVAIGHVKISNKTNIELFERLLKRGVYLQFDVLGDPWQDSESMINAIATLMELGYSTQLLVSQDIFTKFHLRRFDGHGLSYIHSVVIPSLREKGVNEIAIRELIENNPRRVLTFVEPQPLLHTAE